MLPNYIVWFLGHEKENPGICYIGKHAAHFTSVEDAQEYLDNWPQPEDPSRFVICKVEAV